MNFDESYLDSAILADLRKFTELRPEIQQLVGTIAQYKVVLDANVAIADLAYKYKNPHVRQTAIEEAVNSSALVLHAPAWLDEEMTRSAIPKFAAKRMLPEQHLQDLWIAYKEQLVWMETPLSSESTFPAGGDVNDIPYVVLQRSIAAHAILSRDKDIDALGGNRVELEFVFSLRSYARAASYSIGIRVCGVVVAVVSLELLAQLVKTISSIILELPPAIRVALVSGVILVGAHPQSRKRVIELLSGLRETLAGSWPTIETLIETASRKQAELQIAIGDTERLLNTSVPPPRLDHKSRIRRKRRSPVSQVS